MVRILKRLPRAAMQATTNRNTFGVIVILCAIWGLIWMMTLDTWRVLLLGSIVFAVIGFSVMVLSYSLVNHAPLTNNRNEDS